MKKDLIKKLDSESELLEEEEKELQQIINK